MTPRSTSSTPVPTSAGGISLDTLFRSVQAKVGNNFTPAEPRHIIRVAAALGIEVTPEGAQHLQEYFPRQIIVVRDDAKGSLYVLRDSIGMHSAVVYMPGHEPKVRTTPERKRSLERLRTTLSTTTWVTPEHRRNVHEPLPELSLFRP